jgi:hypothetical protein
MINDATLNFVNYGTGLSLVGAAGVDFATDPIDLMGAGPGTTVTNIWGNSTLPFSPDARGVGDPTPLISILIGTAFVNDTGTPTLTVEFQGAPDNGSGSPGTYDTYRATGAIATASLTAGQVIRMEFVPPFPLNDRPRFLRLNFSIPAGTNYSAGTIASATVITGRDDWYVGQQARNYTLGPLS